jgi:hypothetical protein
MKKSVIAVSAGILLLGLVINAYSLPSQSEAYNICIKKVKLKVGIYSGSDPGLRKHMQQHIEKCMAKFGYNSEK